MDSHAHKFHAAEPYEVQTGARFEHARKFATFSEALSYYRGWMAAGRDFGMRGPEDAARIINADRADGAEDGNPSGLTEDEREQLSNAE